MSAEAVSAQAQLQFDAPGRSCARCQAFKLACEFPAHKTKAGKHYLHSNCRACRREQCRSWSKTPGGKAVKREGVLRRKFRMSAEDYDRMSAAQDHVCAICRQPEKKQHHTGTLLKLSIDHDHTTGAVRALLCSMCNVGLGSFSDRPDVLRAAAAYLESFKARNKDPA